MIRALDGGWMVAGFVQPNYLDCGPDVRLTAPASSDQSNPRAARTRTKAKAQRLVASVRVAVASSIFIWLFGGGRCRCHWI